MWVNYENRLCILKIVCLPVLLLFSLYLFFKKSTTSKLLDAKLYELFLSLYYYCFFFFLYFLTINIYRFICNIILQYFIHIKIDLICFSHWRIVLPKSMIFSELHCLKGDYAQEHKESSIFLRLVQAFYCIF